MPALDSNLLSVGEVGVETTVENFFGYLKDGDAAEAPAHYVVALPTSEFGLSSNGLEAIPDGSTFYIANVDVTAALRGAIAGEGASRVPAFGGV